MTLVPEDVRVNVSASFPTMVVGANGIGVTKAFGIYTIANNFPSLAPIGSIPVPANKLIEIYDTTTGVYNTVPLSAIPAFSGSYAFNGVAVASGNYTAGTNDDLIVVQKTTGAPTTVTMVAAASRGRGPVYVKDGKGDAATNNITVAFNGTEKADGLTTVPISTAYGSVTLAPNPAGGGWVILNFG